jgi:hypothetical protein
MYRRVHSLDAVYAQRWDQVEKQRDGISVTGVDLRPWQEQVSEKDALCARWYTKDELQAAIQATLLSY